MGIFTRFRDIVSANINSMLDKAEDPEKLIKLMIHEMEDTLIELKSSCAGVIAGRKKLERKLDEINGKIELWDERAALAVAKGKDNLAREALIEKRRFAQTAEALDSELTEYGNLIHQYQEDIGELENKLNSAKEKKRLLVQRHKRASRQKTGPGGNPAQHQQRHHGPLRQAGEPDRTDGGRGRAGQHRQEADAGGGIRRPCHRR